MSGRHIEAGVSHAGDCRHIQNPAGIVEGEVIEAPIEVNADRPSEIDLSAAGGKDVGGVGAVVVTTSQEARQMRQIDLAAAAIGAESRVACGPVIAGCCGKRNPSAPTGRQVRGGYCGYRWKR